MKVFLDVGAHIGQTLEVVRDPRWGFERIVSFEPAPDCWPKIEAHASPVSELCRFGLWSEDTKIALNNAGEVGASVSADKDRVSAGTVECEFRDAGAWFKDNLSPDAEVWAKINVEGAEAELIQRLAETGTLSLIDHLLIHFDVRKVPSKRHLEQRIREQLEEAGVDYIPADQIQFGGVYRGTRNWLAWCHANPRTRDLRYKTLSRWAFRGRRLAYPLKRTLAQAEVPATHPV